MECRAKQPCHSRSVRNLLFRLPLCLLMSLGASAQQADHPFEPSDFVGTWVRHVDQRTFFILRVQLHQGKLEGTVSRPKHFGEVAGEEPTVTDPAPMMLPLLQASVAGRELKFSTPDPDGKGKPDENTLILWDSNNASLVYHNWEGMPRWGFEEGAAQQEPSHQHRLATEEGASGFS